MTTAYEFNVDGCGKLALHDYTDLSSDQHQQVLAMRNHPQIKRWMYNSENISLTEHMGFIEKLKVDDSKKYFLVTAQANTLGTVNLKQIDKNNGSAEFGIFTNPELSRKGLGSCLLSAIEMYAFDILKLSLLKLEVFSENEKAIALYKRFSYQTVGTRYYEGRELICMQKQL